MVSINKLLRGTIFMFCAGLMAACASQQSTAQLSGEVTYRMRMALPPNAQVEVKISDVSLQDVAAKAIAQETIKTDGKQVPIPFTLSYDPTQLQAGHTYSVSAKITVDGKLWFISTEHIPVKLDGTDTTPVVIWVDQVGK